MGGILGYKAVKSKQTNMVRELIFRQNELVVISLGQGHIHWWFSPEVSVGLTLSQVTIFGQLRRSISTLDYQIKIQIGKIISGHSSY